MDNKKQTLFLIFFLNCGLVAVGIIVLFVLNILDKNIFNTIALVVLLIIAMPLVLLAIKIRGTTETSQKNQSTETCFSVVKHFFAGVIAYDENYTVWLANDALEKLTGIPNYDLMGKPVDLRTLEQFRSNPNYQRLLYILYPSLAPAMQLTTPDPKMPQVIDLSITNPPIELRISSAELFDKDNHKIGTLKIVQDRTQEVAMLKSRSEFVTIASHQLRTPLAAVKWALQALMTETMNDSQKELVTTGFSAANNLSSIIEDLIDVSKLEGGKIELKKESIEINNFLEATLQDFKNSAQEKSVTIELREVEPITISIDKEKMKMVLGNLLDNAIRYNRPNGKVSVLLEEVKEKSALKITIEDTGLGIPRDGLQKMFTKFYRGENVITKETEGSGLGLYITKMMVEAHGGEIGIDSTLGVGTKVWVVLPRN